MLQIKHRFSEEKSKFYFQQIVKAVIYIHQHQHIVHRDLKLANIFLRENTVKVGDFGMAIRLDKIHQRHRIICGTPNYLAPEILERKMYSYQVDIWSLGVILFTMVVGYPPFESSNIECTFQRIKNNNYQFPDNLDLSYGVKELIRKLLDPEPSQR